MKKTHKNKNVIITGGANGIGRAAAILYAQKGANVTVIDIDKGSINCFMDKNYVINVICCDISNEKEIQQVAKNVYKEIGSIDVLINSAAKQTVASLDKMKIDEWKDVLNTNLNGTFICIKYFSKYMSNESTILNITSVHHDKPRMNKYHYDASKAAICSLTKELALELVIKGITVNAISIGATATNMNNDWLRDDEEVKKVVGKVPLGILFSPEQIAEFILTINEKFSRFTTGSIFTIDGGRSLT